MDRIWSIPKIQFLSFSELAETRQVALVYSAPAWQAVEEKLRLPVEWKVEVCEATVKNWDQQMADLQGEVVYAVGGGLIADAAKYMAMKRDLPLVCLPTALSVDAFFTWASGIRENGCVKYIETKSPEQVIVDLKVIAEGPETIRAAGICDVLSIASGKWDWKFADELEKNPPGMKYIPFIEQAAGAILEGALDCAEAAGMGDPDGLKQLLDCIALEVQLTNQIGHARPEEGSEHYFAYAAENETGPGWPHADLLGPGILLMMTIQGQETKKVRKALQEAHIRLDRIPEVAIRRVLQDLPGYCREHDLPYGIAHELTEEAVCKLDIRSILA
jgi:glycerol-1-phosphate dehydrogenase [NAD(P)+]